MMENFNILGQNKEFIMDAYNLHPFIGIFVFLGLVDLALKGWAMWRAARMNKNWWFVALLIINSMGILPAIFLLMTRDEYEKKTPLKSASSAAALLKPAAPKPKKKK